MVGSAGIKSSVIIFAIFLVFASLALWAASGEDVWSEIGRLTFVQGLGLLALSLSNYVLRALRWLIFTRALGLRIGVMRVLRHYFGGFALTLTPARLGEIVRMRWIARETGTKAETLAPLILVDRAGDLASTGLLLAMSLAAGATGIAGGVPVALLAVIVALIATRPTLFLAFVDASYGVIHVKPRLFVKMRRAARALHPFSTIEIMAPALLLGGLGWFAEGYGFFLLLHWLGADISLFTCISIFLFAMMTGGATGLPGGVGGAEAAMLALLAFNHVPLEISVPATAIIRITTLWFAIGLGVLIFPFAERLSARSHHALENN